MTKALIITNCTAASFAATEPILEGASIEGAFTTGEFVEEWMLRINALPEETKKYTALELYKGLSLSSVLKMQDYFDETEICIASLGYGLIRQANDIHSYNLNLEKPENSSASLYSKITKEKFLPDRWWSLLNERLYDTRFPIAQLLNKSNYDIVIITTTVKFLSLIAEDLAQVNDYSKMRILGITKSKSIPTILRGRIPAETFLPYDRRISKEIPGNRTDLPHRCALHYVREIVPEYYNDITAENVAILKKMHDINPTGATEKIVVSSEKLISTINKMKEEGLPARLAYNQIKTLRYKCSAKRFDLLWSGALKQSNKLKQNQKQLDAAKEALSQIPFEVTGAADYTEVLESIRIFQAIIQEKDPTAIFTARDISFWAKHYYKILDKNLPEILDNPTKLSRLITEMYEDLGLETVDSVGRSGPSQYRLNISKQDTGE